MQRACLSIALLICLMASLIASSAFAYNRRNQPTFRDDDDVADDVPAGDERASESQPRDAVQEDDLSGNSDYSRVPGTLTLEECIRRALSNSRRLRGAEYEIEAAKGQLTEAKALLWPVLEYNYRAAPVPTDVDHAFERFFEGQLTLFNSIHVGIGMPVASFGQLKAAKRLAEGGLEASRINEAKARETTTFQVKQLYYGVLLAKEMIKLLGDAVEKISDKIADEDAKEMKDISPYDLMQLSLTKVDLERRLDEARSNLELAYEGLRLQMDMEPGVEIVLEANQLRPVLAALGQEQDYVDAAVELQPDSRLLDVGVDVKRSQYRLERAKLLPQAGVGLFFDIGRTTGFVAGVTATGDYNDPFNYTRAGMGLQLKGTIDFHGAYGRIKKARAEYYKASFDRLFAKRALALDVRKAYLTARRAEEDVRRAKRAESLARQMMFISKVNLDMGIGDSDKYGEALKMVLLTRGSYFKAVFDYNIALADIEQRIGLARFEELTQSPGADEYEFFGAGQEEKEFQTYGAEDGVTRPPEPQKGERDEDSLE